MELLKKSFEKNLKAKLAIKSSGNIEENILLLKAFKFYDTNNLGKIDKDAFAQALSKLGFYGYTDTDLDKLFLMYSNNEQYLDYQNFADTLFNNAPLIKKEEEKENISKNEDKEEKEEPQEEEQDLIEILIMRLRSLLSKRGLENMISIETGFRDLDTQNTQELDFSTFKSACDKFDFQLTEEEIKELFLAFTKEETTKVNYDEFIRILRGELSQNRKELVEQVYKSINEENKEGLNIEEVFGFYNPKGSYEFLYLKDKEENAKKIFENTFNENHIYLNGEKGKDKLVDLDEFIDYYESVSLMIHDDDTFREVILKSWNLYDEKQENQKEQKVQNDELKKEEEKIEKEPEQEIPKENTGENIDNNNNVESAYEKEKEFRKNLLGEKNIDVFRDTLSAKGIKTIINFLNQLKQYDRKGDKEISFPDLFEIFNNLNLHISEKDAKILFSDFEENSKMNYSKFISVMIENSLNERRQNIIKEAFNRLDTEKCGIVNLSDIKNLFSSKNCPLVKEGDVTEEEFYNNFMETFQTHHNLVRSPKIKKVNFDEFLNYYKYFSLTIEDDYLFEETLISCWKLSKSKQAYAGPKDNVKNIIQAPAEKKEESQIIKNISLEGKPKTAKKFFEKNAEYQIPYGTNTESTDYSNLLHPKGDLNGIKLNKNMDPMSIFRRKVFSRGPRSIMSLRRTFMLYDEDKSNQLTYTQFDKFINDYRLNIEEEDKKKIFKLFNKNNSESIDYNELIKGLIGTMNLFRTRIVEKAFEKLDKEKKGKISFDTIINSYDPYKHPQVLNGQRNAEEVLGRFIDIFEYHFNLLNQDKTDEDVTKEEFMEFYNYISACFFDDYEFENITTRVWGLSANENFGKIKHSKKN